jgi:hypothetical protein
MTLNPIAIIRSLVPTVILARIDDLLNNARALLAGETLRAIGLGALAVIWAVWHGALALGLTHVPAPTLDVIAAAVSAAVLLIQEWARKFVSSPATVAAIVATPPTSAGPINAAAAAGVDPALIGQAIAAAPDAPADVAVAPAVVAATPAADPAPEVDPSTIVDGGDAG